MIDIDAVAEAIKDTLTEHEGDYFRAAWAAIDALKLTEILAQLPDAGQAALRAWVREQ